MESPCSILASTSLSFKGQGSPVILSVFSLIPDEQWHVYGELERLLNFSVEALFGRWKVKAEGIIFVDIEFLAGHSHGTDGIWMQPPTAVLSIVLWVVGALYGNWSSRREIEIVLVSPHKLFVFWVTATHHAWRGLNVKVQVQAQAQNWWSFKLSIAKFCSTANIWGEICKNIKSKFWASNLF